MPAGSSAGEPLGWPSNNHLAPSLIDFAREEAFYDTERMWLIFDRARRQLFISQLNAIEQQERERPNTEDPYGKDAHGLTEMGRLQLDHVDYIRLYGDPLPLNTDVGKKCLTAEAAAEEAQAWYDKVKRWKVPAVDSEIFRYFWSDRFMRLLRDAGEGELLQGLEAQIWATREQARRFVREVACGDIPQADGISSPPPSSQSTTRDPPGPASAHCLPPLSTPTLLLSSRDLKH